MGAIGTHSLYTGDAMQLSTIQTLTLRPHHAESYIDPGLNRVPTGLERYEWDQMPEESSKNYSRFLIFRDLPPFIRTIRQAWRTAANRAAASGHGNAPAYWYKAAIRFSWKDRACAWDAYCLRIESEALLRAIITARVRNIEMLTDTQEKLRERLDMLDPQEISPRTLLDAVEAISAQIRAECNLPIQFAQDTSGTDTVEVVAYNYRQAIANLAPVEAEVIGSNG